MKRLLIGTAIVLAIAAHSDHTRAEPELECDPQGDLVTWYVCMNPSAPPILYNDDGTPYVDECPPFLEDEACFDFWYPPEDDDD